MKFYKVPVEKMSQNIVYLVIEKVTHYFGNGKSDKEYSIIFTSENRQEAIDFIEKQEENHSEYINGREYGYELIHIPIKGGETRITLD